MRDYSEKPSFDTHSHSRRTHGGVSKATASPSRRTRSRSRRGPSPFSTAHSRMRGQGTQIIPGKHSSSLSSKRDSGVLTGLTLARSMPRSTAGGFYVVRAWEPHDHTEVAHIDPWRRGAEYSSVPLAPSARHAPEACPTRYYFRPEEKSKKVDIYFFPSSHILMCCVYVYTPHTSTHIRTYVRTYGRGVRVRWLCFL